MNIRVFLITLFLSLLLSGKNLTHAKSAITTRQDLIDSCMARHESTKPKTYETECFTYGNKTECKSKESSQDYSPYASHLVSACAEEANTKIESMAVEEIQKSWPDIASSLVKAGDVSTNKKIKWGSPPNETFGTVEIIRDGKNSKGQICRQLKVSAYVSGEIHIEIVAACLSKSGWSIVE